jgi:hypothetical protein
LPSLGLTSQWATTSLRPTQSWVQALYWPAPLRPPAPWAHQLYTAPSSSQGLAFASLCRLHGGGCWLPGLRRGPTDPLLSPPVHVQHESQVPRHEPASPRVQWQRALDRHPCANRPPSCASTASIRGHLPADPPHTSSGHSRGPTLLSLPAESSRMTSGPGLEGRVLGHPQSGSHTWTDAATKPGLPLHRSLCCLGPLRPALCQVPVS